jgi:hypothetical protein
MSTLAEIESAIQRLSASDREELESRLLSHRFGMDALDSKEHAELLSSLDEAEREIDNGQGVSADDLRREIGKWVGR